jgi:hypothetical protein
VIIGVHHFFVSDIVSAGHDGPTMRSAGETVVVGVDNVPRLVTESMHQVLNGVLCSILR